MAQSSKFGKNLEIAGGNVWKFWAIITSEGTRGASYQVEEIVKVNQVQQFFKYYNQIPKPSEFSGVNGKRVQLGFFKDGITPAWEAADKNGNQYNKGSLGYVFQEKDIDQVWELLLFMCVGNMFEHPKACIDGTIQGTAPPALNVTGILVGRGRQMGPRTVPDYTVDIWVGEEAGEKMLQSWNEYLQKVWLPNDETKVNLKETTEDEKIFPWKGVGKMKAKSFLRKAK